MEGLNQGQVVDAHDTEGCGDVKEPENVNEEIAAGRPWFRHDDPLRRCLR
jgi:hypothetical protein